jgi:hypothetical protein
VLPIDEVRAEQLRRRILFGLIGFGVAWGLSLLSLALDLHGMPPFGALAILPYAWAWAAWAQIHRFPRAQDWSPSPGDRDVVWFLLLFGPIAIISVFSLFVLVDQTASEGVPNRPAAAEKFAKAFGDSRDDATLIYLGRRDLSGGNNPLDSDPRDILKFSVRDFSTGERLLRGSGFELSREKGSRYEKNFHPRNFPVLWRPVSLGRQLDFWRSRDAIAWFDTENLAVYVVLPPGWSPNR